MTIFELENKYKTTLETIKEWGYIRIPLGVYLQNKLNKTVKKQEKNTLFYKIANFSSMTLYGFTHWFRSYDYLYFSDSSERKVINGELFDKSVDPIIDVTGKKSSLLIETVIKKPKRKVHTKYFVSINLLIIVAKIIRFFLSEKTIALLDEIMLEEKINFDYKHLIKEHNSYYYTYLLLFKLYKPKLIFVNCFYCRLGLVDAAKKLNIKVIDIQHGVVNSVHYAYSSNIKIEKSSYPDTLFAFGENEVSQKNKIIEEVIPIGNFYLEYICNNFQQDIYLIEIIQRYKVAISISMQDAEQWEKDSILNFIQKISRKNQDILYILIPRNDKNLDIKNYNNIMIYDKLDCYNVVMHTKIHMTLYSSCALEVLSFGIPNILVDIKGFATLYYQDMLENQYTKIVNTVDEALDAINLLSKVDRQKVIEQNRIFKADYNNNIKNYFLNIEDKR